MLNVIQVAKYFLSKDEDGELFNKKLVTMNGRTFYEGNAKLNKFLHMAQNVYIAKTGEKLFAEDLYAYDNGAVAPEVQEKYAILLTKAVKPELPEDIVDFLDKLYVMLKDAPLDELIEISHEDPEWVKKHTGYSKREQRMDSLMYAEEYRVQYSDVLRLIERMCG